MGDKSIVWQRADGGVSITWPVEPMGEHETEAAYLARIAAGAVPDGTPYRVMDRVQLQGDRTFRDAWTFSERGQLGCDMARAREIQRAHIRAARAPLLAALDVAYQRADEQGDAAAKAEIAARKQALRDAPAHPAIEAAKTPDELKAVWPL